MALSRRAATIAAVAGLIGFAAWLAWSPLAHAQPAVAPATQPQRERPTYWYMITVHEPRPDSDVVVYHGSSQFNERTLSDHLRSDEPILLSDVCWIDQQHRVVEWEQVYPHGEPRVYLNPRFVIAIAPLKGDPRQMQAQQDAQQ